MTIKFLYPNPQQKAILDELEKINTILSKPPSPQLQKNMRFVRNFTYALLTTGRSHRIKKKPVKEPTIIQTKPLEKFKEIKPLPAPKIEKPLAPPPPPPPSKVITQLPTTTPTFSKLKKENNILKYESIEPVMEPQDWKIFSRVKNVIKQQLLKDPNVLENESFLTEEIKKVAKELKIKFSPDYVKKIKYYLNKHIKGFGKIDPLMQDPKVTSINCISYDNLNVTYNSESLQTNIKFDTNEEMNNFIINLAERFDKRISEDTPTLEFSTDKFKISINYNPIMGSSFRIDKL